MAKLIALYATLVPICIICRVTWFFALLKLEITLVWRISGPAPDFETSVLCVTYLTTAKALCNIFFLTFTSLVAHFVALETEFSMAHEGIVLSATKYASILFALVWTFSCHMTKLFASEALYCRIRVYIVSRSLRIQLVKHVIYFRVCSIFALLTLYVFEGALLRFFFLNFIRILAEIHIAFQSASRSD